MRTIQEIMNQQNPDKIYDLLTAQRRRKTFSVPLDIVLDQYNPYTHNVMNPEKRKKKTVKVSTGKKDPRTGELIYKEKKIERCRIAVPIQRILVERTVGFMFGIPVDYKVVSENADTAKDSYNDLMNILHDNKMEYFDKKLARALFSERECAELWYFLPDDRGNSKDMRVKLLSPTRGDKLFPHFDDYDRMDGFARKYKVYDEEGNQIEHFDVYTNEYIYAYTMADQGGLKLVEGYPMPHGFKKIPVIYYRQEESEWNSVQPVIERVEELLSNWGDTNDYFGTPSYFFKGKLTGFAEKGETGRVYQGEGEGADMRVLSWDSSPESVKGELANLFNIIFSYTQTPDVSFETMKTLGSNTSGVALKLMFTDPHMKANMKIETFGEMFTRRINVVKSGYYNNIKARNASEENTLRIEPIFTPYLPKNELEQIQMINLSTGGKATTSQENGVELNPINTNPEAIKKQLEAEQQQDAMAQMMDALTGESAQ